MIIIPELKTLLKWDTRLKSLNYLEILMELRVNVVHKNAFGRGDRKKRYRGP